MPFVTVPRDKRFPGLYLRGSIYWLSITSTVTRKRHFISLRTRDFAEAVAKAMAGQGRPDLMSSGVWMAEVEAYIDERTREGKLSPMYARSRKTHLKMFGEANGITAPAQVTPKLMQRWHDERAKLNAETAKHYVLHVRALLKWLVAKNRLREDATAGVRFHSRVARYRDNFVAREKVAELLDNAPTDDLRLILLLGFECGMRRTEICEARIGWLNLAAGTITIPARDATFQRKNRRASTVPLTARAREFFSARAWPGPFLLRPTKSHGKHSYRVEFEDAFTEYVNARGVKCTIHDMRRSFCSNRIAAGMSVEEVAFIVGDTPQVVWRNYARFIPATARAELGAA